MKAFNTFQIYVIIWNNFMGSFTQKFNTLLTYYKFSIYITSHVHVPAYY